MYVTAKLIIFKYDCTEKTYKFYTFNGDFLSCNVTEDLETTIDNILIYHFYMEKNWANPQLLHAESNKQQLILYYSLELPIFEKFGKWANFNEIKENYDSQLICKAIQKSS